MKLAKLLAVLLFACVLPACSTHDGARDGGDQKMSVSADEAAEFGAVTLPQGIEVLGANTDSGRDTRYRLALRMNDAQLAEFLGQFPERPRKSDIPKSTPVIAGPALSSAPDPRYFQDGIGTADHGVVTREVIVDERSPGENYVHLAFYTT